MSRNVSRRDLLVGSATLPFAAAGAGLLLPTAAAAQTNLLGGTNDLRQGGELQIPDGQTVLPRPFRFAGQRLNLRGVGANASTIRFDPSAPAAAIELNTPGPGGQFQSSVTGLGFVSGNGVDKTAIRLVNVANVNIERVGIASGNWLGAGSIGIHTAGRQMVRIRDCDIVCARPIVISRNPVHPGIAADFFEIHQCELISSVPEGVCIEVEDGVVLSNIAVRDTALVGGLHGFRFNDRSSVGVSHQIEFENVRTEQGTDLDGWSFDIGSTAQSIQNILFQSVRCEPGRNGIRIRNGQRITMINVDIDQRGGRTALDIAFVPGTILTIIGGFAQVGSSVRLAKARKVIGVESSIGGPMGPMEVWVYDREA